MFYPSQMAPPDFVIPKRSLEDGKPLEGNDWELWSINHFHNPMVWVQSSETKKLQRLENPETAKFVFVST